MAGMAAAGAPAMAWAGAKIRAVAAESQYADVIRAIGGGRVAVAAIETNPNTDPHSFEASASVAREVAQARLVVVNGLGYDSWAARLLRATGGAGRRHVIDAQTVLKLPGSTRNPHLWYDPRTMPAVAAAIAAALSALDPAHAAEYRRNLVAFGKALDPWRAEIARFRAAHQEVGAAVTEPVGNYLLQAMGIAIATPWTLQEAVMNGTDPAPQDIATQSALLRGGKVKLFGYNRQVSDPLTRAMLNEAAAGHVPVVGLYETMPAGFEYPGWMLAATRAVARAVEAHVSTMTLARPG